METRVHACEKQFRLGLQKGMEDFPLFLKSRTNDVSVEG